MLTREASLNYALDQGVLLKAGELLYDYARYPLSDRSPEDIRRELQNLTRRMLGMIADADYVALVDHIALADKLLLLADCHKSPSEHGAIIKIEIMAACMKARPTS